MAGNVATDIRVVNLRLLATWETLTLRPKCQIQNPGKGAHWARCPFLSHSLMWSDKSCHENMPAASGNIQATEWQHS